jgi:branched-chain amino acid transport system substrate-binding protein
MDHEHTCVRRASIAVVVAILVAACVLATPSGAQSSSEPGITKDEVKVGYIYSGSGLASSGFDGVDKACQARIDDQNAQGGVHGRKIKMEMVDDKSSANLNAAQDLVQSKDVFAVVNNSALAFLAYRFLQSNGVPIIGGGFDGTYYGEKGNENIISALGNSAPVDGLSNTVVPKVMKQLGATKTATVAYGVSPSSVAAAKSTQDYGVPAVGLKPVYTNTAVDFGSTDVGPVVLGIKNSGADGVFLPLDESTNFAIVQGLLQNGVTMKANVLATGYGPAVLDQPIGKTLGPNTVFASPFKPVELKTPATRRFQADLKKYAGSSGIPNFGQYLGYIACDLTVKGLEAAGPNPTRQGLIDGIRKMGTYDQAGLACTPVNMGLDTFGKTPETGCEYFLFVKDGKFVVLNKGKPMSGKLVGSKEAVAAARSGSASSATTTTVASPAP